MTSSRSAVIFMGATAISISFENELLSFKTECLDEALKTNLPQSSNLQPIHPKYYSIQELYHQMNHVPAEQEHNQSPISLINVWQNQYNNRPTGCLLLHPTVVSMYLDLCLHKTTELPKISFN